MKYIIISVLTATVMQLSAQTSQCDSFCIQFIKGDKSNDFEFILINNTQDTLYLFDSYLNDDLCQSMYLHRFDKKEKLCKLSFLPLLPFLSVRNTDCIILTNHKVINRGQVLYHFKVIPPQSRNKVTISNSAFYAKDYVNEVYPQRISKFEQTIKFRKNKNDRCDSIIVEFALYKSINLLTSEKAYYFDECSFNEQALSYFVLSVLVNLCP